MRRASSGLLAASGLAGVVMPRRVAEALDLTPGGGRGLLEVRAGLGGGYLALGLWALASDTPGAHRAVGVAWLGAASGRLLGMLRDDPDTDAVHWGSLALEVGGGLVALAATRPSGASR